MYSTQESQYLEPLISVAICTYNRAERLFFALEGLKDQTLAIKYFEILVVDNGSTDNTKDICGRYQKELTNLRYIYEPVLGLSQARNTALYQVNSQYIAYLDDDAIPCRFWLESILETFKNVEPQPVCVGGPIYGLWEIPKPGWIHDYMEPLFSVLDYGEQPQWFKPQRFPFGANMTYNTDKVRRIGGFCKKLGRQGKNLLSHEEFMLNLILEKQGERFYYSPKSTVQHWIPKERINPTWLMRRSYWQGISEALVDSMLGKSLIQQRQESVFNLLNFQRIIAQLFPEQKVRITTRARISYSWGYFLKVWFNL